jgi:hypothetical protein
MNTGWISLWRKLMDKGYYKKSEYVHLWVHLLFKANHEPSNFQWNQKDVVIKAGQFITGRKKLSEETGISESKCERILKVFENEQQIEQQKTNLFRLITILNYNGYQKSEQQIEQPVNNKCTTNEQPVNTNNNKNNNNKENNENKKAYFNEFWKAYPNKTGKLACIKAWEKLKPNKELLDKMLIAIEEQKQWRLNAHGEFRPPWKNPATWLNAGCWEDEITKGNGNGKQNENGIRYDKDGFKMVSNPVRQQVKEIDRYE